MDKMTAPPKEKQKCLAAVQVTDPTTSMLTDGTWTKSKKSCQVKYSFLKDGFWDFITLMYVQVLISFVCLASIRFWML